MNGGFVVDILLILSLVTGTAALTLCLLIWDILKHSYVGRTVAMLTVLLGLFNLYHGALLLVPNDGLLSSILKSVAFTGVLLFIGMSIRIQHRVEQDAETGGNS